MLKRMLTPAGSVLSLVLLSAGAASAAEDPASPVAIAEATLHWTETPASADGSGETPKGLQVAEKGLAPAAQPTDEALGDLSGRGTGDVAAAVTEQSLSAINTGNTINAGSLVSGPISLQDSALSGFSGIGNILMNTGANNNLQSTMSVTVVITH
jgi:hypothetical protein